MSFTHLHLHTEYSLLDGACRINQLMDRLKELGFTKITGSTVFQWNTASQKLHESMGFRRVSDDEKEITYEREL